MRPEKFGDSYDFMKRTLIHGLAEPNEWATHPMYFDPCPEQGFVQRYADYLGVALVRGNLGDRALVPAVGTACPVHLLLDPDTGVWTGDGIPEGGWGRHLTLEELAEVARAPGRENLLTMVFDQSYTHTNMERRLELAWDKLAALNLDGLHGSAYVAQAVFLWLSPNVNLIPEVTGRFLNETGLPDWRVVQYP